MTDTAEVRRHLAAMTPGEWEVKPVRTLAGENYPTNYQTWVFIEPSVCGLWAEEGRNLSDAAGIAFLRNHAAAMCDEIEALRERVKTLEKACSGQNYEICQTLGRALGYPRFCDDQKNFPGYTDADGVCVGEHVAETLASEAAKQIDALRAANMIARTCAELSAALDAERAEREKLAEQFNEFVSLVDGFRREHSARLRRLEPQPWKPVTADECNKADPSQPPAPAVYDPATCRAIAKMLMLNGAWRGLADMAEALAGQPLPGEST